MEPEPSPAIVRAELSLPGTDLGATVAFFTETLGFGVEVVAPADDPSVVVVSGHGLRLRFDRDHRGPPGSIRLACEDPDAVAYGARALTAPNGTQVKLVEADPPLELPPPRPSFAVALAAGARWIEGRAKMAYRDLIPGRQGGRFVASQIRVPEAGPVPDWVHFDRVRLQLIVCRAGWMRVVYEDQGPPFVLEAGDCVLEPPGIRHRVLEASEGLEWLELSCPARYDTVADPDLALPTEPARPDRRWAGQRFVHHVAADARWAPWRAEGFEVRDTGIEAATDGAASARVVRGEGAAAFEGHADELLWLFVLDGSLRLDCEGRDAIELSRDDAVSIPAGWRFWIDAAAPVELLEVSVRAEPEA